MLVRKLKTEVIGLEGILLHQNKIKELKRNKELVEIMFAELKIAILTNDYFKAKEISEDIFLEKLEKFYIDKLFSINKSKIDAYINIWIDRFFKIGEQGFCTTILSSF